MLKIIAGHKIAGNTAQVDLGYGLLWQTDWLCFLKKKSIILFSLELRPGAWGLISVAKRWWASRAGKGDEHKAAAVARISSDWKRVEREWACQCLILFCLQSSWAPLNSPLGPPRVQGAPLGNRTTRFDVAHLLWLKEQSLAFMILCQPPALF